MKNSQAIVSKFVTAVALLYVLLFLYAAVSKLLDYENFQVQLRQSPLLSSFAGWVSWLVPFSEIVLAVLLLFPSRRQIGLYGSFVLMVMFTAYIYIILNYSAFVPCSCGGILEKLSWKQHLYFNVLFVVLAAVAVFLNLRLDNQKEVYKKRVFTALQLGVWTVFATAFVAGLFVWSEHLIHHDNNFTRRFEQHPVVQQRSAELGFESYYFAGTGDGNVFLGNATAPSIMTVADTALKQLQTHKISLDEDHLKFRAVEVKVRPPYFYVMDGTVPCVFSGHTSDWKSRLVLKGGAYFMLPELIDSTTIAFRIPDPKTGINLLGTLSLSDPQKIKYSSALLEKQVDGFFDTDGTLLYSPSLQRLVYTYYYRNQFIVAKPGLELDYRGHTIDTTTQAKIEIATVASRNEKKMSAPPLMVNQATAICHNLLFVHSVLQGRYESDKMWKQAAVIDVYDLLDNTYLFSFYIHDHDGKRLRKFIVTDTQLFALIGTKLVSYQLQEQVIKAFRQGTPVTQPWSK